MSHCWWLWHQICWQRQCRTPKTSPQAILQNHNKLGGTKYVGLIINWNYANKQVHLCMPGYVHEALKRFNHKRLKKMQHQPYPHVPPYCGKKSNMLPLPTQGQSWASSNKNLSKVTGTFLYYARAVNGTMLTTLSALTTEQAKPAATMMQKNKQSPNYAASNSNVMLTYNASNMVLAVHHNASHLDEKQAQSRAGRHFSFSTNDVFLPKMAWSSTQHK